MGMVCDSFRWGYACRRRRRSVATGMSHGGSEIEIPRLIIERKFDFVKDVFGGGERWREIRG